MSSSVKSTASSSPSLVEVSLELCKEKPREVLKGLSLGIRWADLATPGGVSKEVKALGQATSTATDVFKIAEAPGKLHKIMTAVKAKNPSEALYGAVESVSTVNSITKVLNKTGIISMSQAALARLGAVSSAAFGFLQINGLRKKIISLSEKGLTREQKIARYLDVVQKISYIALALIGLLGFILSIVFPSWWLLLLSTSAFVFGNAGFFYEKIVQPEKKAKLQPT